VSKDWIDELLSGGEPDEDEAKAKHRMTVYLDHELWLKAKPLLKGKFSTVFEQAVRQILIRAGKIEK
jgi:hypothetical protein